MRFITNVPANDFIGAAGARGLPGRQFVGRHQGVLVPRHAGGQHRRAPAGPPERRARHPRRLRRRRHRRGDRVAARARPLRAVARSTTATTPATRSSTCWRRRRSTRRSVFTISKANRLMALAYQFTLKVLGIITARGGSKGIPGKNLKLLARQAAARLHDRRGARFRRARSRDPVDRRSRRSPTPAASLGCDVPFMRPAELSRDETPHLPVIQHAAQWMRDHAGYQPDAVMILQPTSPLRSADDIAAAARAARVVRRRFGGQRHRSVRARAPDAHAARRRRAATRCCLPPASRCAAASTAGRTSRRRG